MAGKKTINHQEEHTLSAEITVLQEISYAIVHKKNVSEYDTRHFYNHKK